MLFFRVNADGEILGKLNKAEPSQKEKKRE